MRKTLGNLFAVFLLTLALSAAARSAEIEGAAAVSSIAGQVERKSGSGDWKRAAQGDALSPGDSIKTGAGSKARLVFEDGTLMVVGELSVFKISALAADYAASTRNSKVSLESGSMRAVVSKKLTAGSGFTVETPTAIAGVRGTDFSVELDDEQTTSVTVFDGQVEVGSILENIRDRVLVDPEHSTDVKRGRAPIRPLRLKKELLERKRERLARRLNPDESEDDADTQDAVSRTAVAARIHKLPEDKKQKLMENVREGRLSADDAQDVLVSVHRGVDRDTAGIALDLASRTDIPRDRLLKVVELVRDGRGADLRQKLEALRDARAGQDGAQNMSAVELDTLRADILRDMDRAKLEQAMSRMNPDDPARRELQIIKDALEKGVTREKLEPLIRALRNGVINDREATLIIEAIRRGVDPQKLGEALRRLNEVRADMKLRMLALKAMSLNVDLEKLMERLKESDLTPEQIRQRLEQIIKERLAEIEKTKSDAMKAQPSAGDQ